METVNVPKGQFFFDFWFIHNIFLSKGFYHVYMPYLLDLGLA